LHSGCSLLFPSSLVFILGVTGENHWMSPTGIRCHCHLTLSPAVGTLFSTHSQTRVWAVEIRWICAFSHLSNTTTTGSELLHPHTGVFSFLYLLFKGT
jgi:hypothetical protein